MKSKSSSKKHIVFGQPSWRIRSANVDAFVTETGGHLAPVVFDRKGRQIQPYSIAPWYSEKLPPDTPPLIRLLRGDFFCLPFGANAEPFLGEQHPLHGESANRKWKFEQLDRDGGRTTLRLSMRTRIRAGRVDKRITLVDGHNAVYCQHIVSDMSGPMDFGHHAMLKFPDRPGSGVLTCSPFKFGMVSPVPLEKPETFGYSILKPGARFSRLNRVPTMTGEWADLSRYPARRGFEDLVLLATQERGPYAWVAVTFPRERYTWFALRDPQVLRHTVLWHSNAGRHYSPWSSRHQNVLGIEDITGFFHYGLAASAKPNALTRRGAATCVELKRRTPLIVNYVMAVARVPAGFTETTRIEPGRKGASVRLISGKGQRVTVNLGYEFVRKGIV